jgi:hypothetical protein
MEKFPKKQIGVLVTHEYDIPKIRKVLAEREIMPSR